MHDSFLERSVDTSRHCLDFLNLGAPACGAMASSRDSKVSLICDKIYEHCIAPNPERIATAAAVLPSHNLRHKGTRDCLKWTGKLEGRYFTRSIVKDALELMLRKYDISLPETLENMHDSWLQKQSTLLQKLLSRSKKSVAMDNEETQAWSCLEFDADGLDVSEEHIVGMDFLYR